MPQVIDKLKIVDGPSNGQEFKLTENTYILGRDASANIVIPDPSVSRRHARITLQAGKYQIEDLGSSNGSYLNNNRLDTLPLPIKHGDEIRLGQSVKLVFISHPQPDPVDKTQVAVPGVSQVAQTVMSEELPDQQREKAPPELVVEIVGQSARVVPLTKDILTIGRLGHNDIVIPSMVVSRQHARLERTGQGYRITVLPEASNPVFLDGRQLTAPTLLEPGSKLRIGIDEPGLMVSMDYQDVKETVSTLETQTIGFSGKTKLRFGRDSSNDIVLNAPNVSRFHAQVEKIGQRYRVRDLNSSNGTFVNGQHIDGEVWLKPNDSIKIGSYRFILGLDELAQIDDSNGLLVRATGLNKWVRKDLNILKDISLVFQPREFIVIVGQSGGGKSTLVDAIAGNRPATHGEVMVNDIDVYRNFDAIHNDIGNVPQKDIIHMELTVYQALDYAARLRMPSDTTKDERHKRILEVLHDLDLTHRKDVQISGLSGGQQKRVSIGVELLTSPGLFTLDEPTSGLDPGTETTFMQLMRRLADQGRTIVLVTHATKNVMLADKVVFLSRGGYLAWFGPPNEALEYFDPYRAYSDQQTEEMEFDKIYAILDDPNKGSPEEWAQRYAANPAHKTYIMDHLQETPRSSAQDVHPLGRKASSQPKIRKQTSAFRQFTILSARNLKILARDRSSLILMLLAAPLVGCLDLLLAPLMGKNLFDYIQGDLTKVSVTLFLLTIYSMLVGGLSQMREIVKEGEIYKRERLVNLKILPYVLSKMWIAALLALYHALAYSIIHYAAFTMPGGLLEFVLIYFTLFLGTLAGMVLGLLASALAPQASSAPLIMILLIVPQIVLSGALTPIPPVASALASTHWTYEALMGITGGASDIAADPCWQMAPEEREALTLQDKIDLGCRCMGTNIFDPNTCNLPGIGRFYHPAVHQPQPVEPLSPGDPPLEPILPDAPQPPADQNDPFAMSEYLTSLENYQQETALVRQAYEAEVELFKAQSEVYRTEVAAYQEAITQREISRTSAIGAAEALISGLRADMGLNFMNKENPDAFYRSVGKTWLANITLIVVMFSAILILMKRKDVRGFKY